MRWSQKERGEFLIRFSLLLKQGYSMKEATTLIAQMYPSAIRTSLITAFSTLENGENLSTIFSSLKFPKDVLSHITFSERHGKIALGSQYAGEWLLKKEAFREQMIQQLKYPLFLIWATILLSFFMIRFLIPQFQQLYDSLNTDFPLVTTMFISFAKGLPYFLLFVLVVLLLCLLYYLFAFRKLSPEKQLTWMIRIPILSSFYQLFCTHTFCLHFGSLLKSGLSIYESVSCFSEDAKFTVLQYEGQTIKNYLLAGYSLEQSLEQSRLFTEELATVVQHGSLTGYLEQELIHYSEMVLTLLDKKMKRVLDIFQPSLFLVVGMMMFFMFLALFMPMFHMMENL
ncbi:competence type IV pilus assembly protein ComGB [Massilibacterium senegalense]|uniref:competence type IV pilus assembly protein ComGB n=1 Tax=Massilibacterium senegalense TaxID=1632858 RepID=UPI0007866349|nr:competence type IV pilus assembly protein ComGB [Massilibacterium senegalense]